MWDVFAATRRPCTRIVREVTVFYQSPRSVLVRCCFGAKPAHKLLYTVSTYSYSGLVQTHTHIRNQCRTSAKSSTHLGSIPPVFPSLPSFSSSPPFPLGEAFIIIVAVSCDLPVACSIPCINDGDGRTYCKRGTSSDPVDNVPARTGDGIWIAKPDAWQSDAAKMSTIQRNPPIVALKLAT